jgi:hypothetical protein
MVARQDNGARPQFADVLERNTGYQLPTQLWASGQTAFAELERQTEYLADILEANGIEARQNRGAITAIGEVTGCSALQIDYRPIRFLPVVAQRDRRGMLRALMYFQQNDPAGRYLRYAVVTSGARIPAFGPLRKTIAKLSRDISRWASEASSLFNIGIIYRGTEFTIDQYGTYHPHANVLYYPRRKLPEDTWSQFLAWSHKRLGAHWRDCGKLVNPNEAIKYPFKPMDLNCRPPEEIVWLFHELFRLKLAQPMSSFKAFWKTLEQEKEKIGSLDQGNGKMALARIGKQKRAKIVPCVSGPLNDENQIIARTVPVPRFGPFFEPISLVKNYTEEPKTGVGRNNLRILNNRKAEARAAMKRNIKAQSDR